MTAKRKGKREAPPPDTAQSPEEPQASRVMDGIIPAPPSEVVPSVTAALDVLNDARAAAVAPPVADPARAPDAAPGPETPDERKRRLRRERERTQRELWRRAQHGAATAAADHLHAAADATARVTTTRASLADENARLAAEVATLRRARSRETQGEVKMLLAGTFDVASAMLAAKRGAHWRARPHEVDRLAEGWAFAIAPHWESIAGYAPLALAAFATWQYADGRLRVDARLATAEELSAQLDNEARTLLPATAARVAGDPAPTTDGGGSDVA